MYEVVWQYDETVPFKDSTPADAAEARRLLIEGNQNFATLFSPHQPSGDITRHYVRVSPQDVGIGGQPGQAPPQVPFAAFLSCADARVPVELIFGQQANDLFVVRVAGNVLGDESLGSLGFAVDQLGTVRLLAVLGHTGCGAVTATVDAYLTAVDYLGVAAKFPLQAIVGKIMPAVHGAASALAAIHGATIAARPGYRQALIEMGVILNAALSAAILSHTFNDTLGDLLQISYGVYDLRHRHVGLPATDPDGEWRVGLFAPPTTEAGFQTLGRQLAQSRYIREIL